MVIWLHDVQSIAMGNYRLWCHHQAKYRRHHSLWFPIATDHTSRSHMTLLKWTVTFSLPKLGCLHSVCLSAGKLLLPPWLPPTHDKTTRQPNHAYMSFFIIHVLILSCSELCEQGKARSTCTFLYREIVIDLYKVLLQSCLKCYSVWLTRC